MFKGAIPGISSSQLDTALAPYLTSAAAAVTYIPRGTTQVEAPTTGQTVPAGAGVTLLVINPAGALLALTIQFPPNPVEGDNFALSFTQAITTLVLEGGTIVGVLTSAVVGQSARWQYVTELLSWVSC